VEGFGIERVNARVPYRATTPGGFFDKRGFQKAVKVSERGWTIRSTVFSGIDRLTIAPEVVI
jgi:hypothetical protein